MMGTDYFRETADGYEFFCPECQCWDKGSPYLRTILTDARVLLLGNLCCHRRHVHTSYDSAYVKTVYRQQKKTPVEYRDEKNEVCKRQLARKCGPWFKARGFTVEDCMGLTGTTLKTISVWEKQVGRAPV